jgi:hypothetical protein
MIAASTSQELTALREESDWVAKQLERLQRVVIHVSPAEGQLTERRPLA